MSGLGVVRESHVTPEPGQGSNHHRWLSGWLQESRDLPKLPTCHTRAIGAGRRLQGGSDAQGDLHDVLCKAGEVAAPEEEQHAPTR